MSTTIGVLYLYEGTSVAKVEQCCREDYIGRKIRENERSIHRRLRRYLVGDRMGRIQPAIDAAMRVFRALAARQQKSVYSGIYLIRTI